MSESLQEKKDGLQLLAALSDDNTRAIFVRSFQNHLTDLVMDLLASNRTPDEVVAIRQEAMGVIAVLNRMGVQMANASEAAVRRATQRKVLQAVGDDVG